MCLTQQVLNEGGVTYVADIVNCADRATKKYIFERLNECGPAQAEEIHKLMFVFGDITKPYSFVILWHKQQSPHAAGAVPYQLFFLFVFMCKP